VAISGRKSFATIGTGYLGRVHYRSHPRKRTVSIPVFAERAGDNEILCRNVLLALYTFSHRRALQHALLPCRVGAEILPSEQRRSVWDRSVSRKEACPRENPAACIATGPVGGTGQPEGVKNFGVAVRESRILAVPTDDQTIESVFGAIEKECGRGH